MPDFAYTKEVFQNDIFATQTTGIKIVVIDDNYAKCELQIEKRHLNAMGVVMGGAIFTLADFTFAVASNSSELSTVSLSSQISYVNAAKCNKLVAEAKCVKQGRSACFYNVEVKDENGNLIATVSTTGQRILK